MTSYLIDADIELIVTELAASTGRSFESVVREAILRGLEDLEDVANADAVMDRINRGEEQIFTLDEVKQHLGLDDRTDERRLA